MESKRHIKRLLRQTTPGNFTQLRQLGRRRALTLYRYQDKNPYYFGRLSELTHDTLELVDDLPYRRGFRYYLPIPITSEQRSLTVVCAYKDRDKMAIYWLLDESLSLVKRGCTPLNGPPLFFHIGSEHLWVIGKSQALSVRMEKMPLPRRFELDTEVQTQVHLELPLCGPVEDQTLAHVVNGHLGLFGSPANDGKYAERLHWIKLDEPDTELSVDWNDAPDVVGSVSGDELFLFGPENDAVAIEPGEGFAEVWDGATPSALALDDEHVYVGTHHHEKHETPGVAKLRKDDATFVEWIELNHGVDSIFPVPQGLIVCSSSQWTFFPANGSTSMTSRTSPAGAIGFAQLADGSCAVNASRELLILPSGGKDPIQLKLPAHGRIIGSVAEGFVFDPEIELALPPDDPDRARDLRLRLASNYELLIIDAKGEKHAPVSKYDVDGSARFKSPVRNIYNGGIPGDDGLILPDRILLTEKNEPAIWSWRG